jgi:hypothetical protein
MANTTVTYWAPDTNGRFTLKDFMRYVELAQRLNIIEELVSQEALTIIVPPETANALKDAIVKTRMHEKNESIMEVITCGCCDCHK